MKNKFCPKCLSKNIETVAGGIAGLYECKKCNYRGTIFPEINNEKNQKRRFCPKCKSENVEVGVAPVGIPNIAALGPINKCLDCGFEAMIFPEKFKLQNSTRL